MGEYGVKITVISFVIAEHLWGLPKEKKNQILLSWASYKFCILVIVSSQRAILCLET